MYGACEKGVDMEKRIYARHPGHIKFLLYRNRIPVVTCQSENIGPDGVFVRSSPVSYSRNTLIEVEFEVRRRGGSNRFRLPAKVVYTTQNGMGLKFVPSNSTQDQMSHIILGNLCNELEVSEIDQDQTGRATAAYG